MPSDLKGLVGIESLLVVYLQRGGHRASRIVDVGRGGRVGRGLRVSASMRLFARMGSPRVRGPVS